MEIRSSADVIIRDGILIYSVTRGSWTAALSRTTRELVVIVWRSRSHICVALKRRIEPVCCSLTDEAALFQPGKHICRSLKSTWTHSMIQLPPFLLNFAKDFCAPLQVPAVWVMKCRKCHHSEDLGAAAAAALTPAATFQPPQISLHSPL